MQVSNEELRQMMEAANITLPVKVQYDDDGGFEAGWYSRWAYRIPGICNLAEEQDETWPGMVLDPEMGNEFATCPRSEYIAAVLNAMPSLFAEIDRLKEIRVNASKERKVSELKKQVLNLVSQRDRLRDKLSAIQNQQTTCPRCKHTAHRPRVCMLPLYWGSKHDADCGCPEEVCFGEGNPWPDTASPSETLK